MCIRLQLAVLLTFFVTLKPSAQIYLSDPGYVLDTLHSDDFDRNYLKSWKWFAYDNVYGGLEIIKSSHVTCAGDTLSIKVDTNTTPVYYNHRNYGYYSGCFDNGPMNSLVKYGYFEIKARFPAGNALLWPAFWFWNQDCPTPTTLWYQEIDMVEIFDHMSYHGREFHSNRYVTNPALTASLTRCPRPDSLIGYSDRYVGDVNTAPTLLYTGFHKYGFLWTPDSVVFYFDDNPVAMSTTFVPQHAMAIIIGLGMTPTAVSNPGMYSEHPPLTSPKYLTLDYLRYYKKNADCSTNKTICSPGTDYYNANPPRAIEKAIVSGGTGCTGSVTYNTSDQCTLRATDSVTLDAGTTTNDNGSGYFAVSIEPCPQ